MQIIGINTLKQVVLLILISFVGIVLLIQLRYFIPGMLAAVTFYIVIRKYFFTLIYKYRWRKWLAALFSILVLLLILGIPTWLFLEMIIPKVNYFIDNEEMFLNQAKDAISILNQKFPSIRIDEDKINEYVAKSAGAVPQVLTATASVIANVLIALFLLYFMLVAGRSMERKLINTLPLKEENKDALWSETQKLVVSNAIGIPVLILAQCAVAALGYWIFGVENYIFWGIVTGVASLIPMVGTMIVWVPLSLFMFTQSSVGMAIGLLIYSVIVIANIDNVLRITLLRRIGDVHPLITFFGVIVGLQLFGVMGLIFGPLLFVYFLLLLKIYRLEFAPPKEVKVTNPEDIPKAE